MGHELGVMILIFGVSDRWAFFTYNIFPGKSYKTICPGRERGSPKWDRITKNTVFTLNCNISWFLNDKRHFFVIKNRDSENFGNYWNFYFANCLPPITATSKTPWFWRFFAFSQKTREIFANYFLIYHRKWLEQFFQYFLVGSPIMFH